MTGRRATRPQNHKTSKKTQASPAISRSLEVSWSQSLVIPEKLRRSQSCEAARYRTWLISEFREINEFRDVRAMPATNQVSDVLPLNRAARSRASLNYLISLNSLLTARYHHAPKRDEFLSEGVRCGASQKKAPRDSTKTYSPWCFTFWDVPQIAPYHAKRLSINKMFKRLHNISRMKHHCLRLGQYVEE